MSTNCAIGIMEGGKIRVIYSHYDGYPDYVGAMLVANYKTPSKIKKLIALGNISSLKETPTKTIAYHKDYGEELQKALKIDRAELGKITWGSYLYIFNVTLNKWFTFKANRSPDGQLIWHQIVVDYKPLIAGLVNFD